MDRIPHAELAKARLRLKRRIAASFLLAMADDDASFGQIDDRLGQRSGSTRRFMIGLMDGTSKAMDEASDLAFGMGREIDFRLVRFADIGPPAAAHAPPEAAAEPTDDREEP